MHQAASYTRLAPWGRLAPIFPAPLLASIIAPGRLDGKSPPSWECDPKPLLYHQIFANCSLSQGSCFISLQRSKGRGVSGGPGPGFVSPSPCVGGPSIPRASVYPGQGQDDLGICSWGLGRISQQGCDLDRGTEARIAHGGKPPVDSVSFTWTVTL